MQEQKVDNLILTIDVNRQQICGSTDKILDLATYKKNSLLSNESNQRKNGNNVEEVLKNLNSQN